VGARAHRCAPTRQGRPADAKGAGRAHKRPGRRPSCDASGKPPRRSSRPLGDRVQCPRSNRRQAKREERNDDVQQVPTGAGRCKPDRLRGRFAVAPSLKNHCFRSSRKQCGNNQTGNNWKQLKNKAEQLRNNSGNSPGNKETVPYRGGRIVSAPRAHPISPAARALSLRLDFAPPPGRSHHPKGSKP